MATIVYPVAAFTSALKVLNGRQALEDDERPRNVVNEENAEIVPIIAEIDGIGIRNIRSVDL